MTIDSPSLVYAQALQHHDRPNGRSSSGWHLSRGRLGGQSNCHSNQTWRHRLRLVHDSIPGWIPVSVHCIAVRALVLTLLPFASQYRRLYLQDQRLVHRQRNCGRSCMFVLSATNLHLNWQPVQFPRFRSSYPPTRRTRGTVGSFTASSSWMSFHGPGTNTDEHCSCL